MKFLSFTNVIQKKFTTFKDGICDPEFNLNTQTPRLLVRNWLPKADSRSSSCWEKQKSYFNIDSSLSLVDTRGEHNTNINFLTFRVYVVLVCRWKKIRREHAKGTIYIKYDVS